MMMIMDVNENVMDQDDDDGDDWFNMNDDRW